MRNFGTDLAGDLVRMGLLPGLVEKAMAGTLAPADFHRALRARGTYLPYLRNLVGRLHGEGRTWRVAKATRTLADRFGGRRFHKTLAEAEARLAAEGRSLPARRQPAAAG
jgi:hypothetical protein